jgi:hypothetical protein
MTHALTLLCDPTTRAVALVLVIVLALVLVLARAVACVRPCQFCDPYGIYHAEDLFAARRTRPLAITLIPHLRALRQACYPRLLHGQGSLSGMDSISVNA